MLKGGVNQSTVHCLVMGSTALQHMCGSVQQVLTQPKKMQITDKVNYSLQIYQRNACVYEWLLLFTCGTGMNWRYPALT